MASPSPSTSASFKTVLDSRFAAWEATLKDVSDSGYASSEEYFRTNDIKIFPRDGKVYYREHNGAERKIERMSDIPGHSMHFRKANKAHYAGANSLETARVEALTRAIYSGSIKITGRYACVNHIGTYPNDNAPPLIAETPVPIKLDAGQEVEGILGYHQVTVAKKKTKKIYVCHIKSEYSPSDEPSPLNSHRIYFSGVLPPKNNLRDFARTHYDEMQQQVHLGTSREVLTETVDITVLGLTNGLITAFYRDYKNGLQLCYSPGCFHIISSLIAPYDEPTNLYKVYESDSDGRHIEIYSKEDVKAIWEYDMTIQLGDKDFAVDRYLNNDQIQKAVRQFKNLTLGGYAKLIRASTLDVVAAFQRRSIYPERSIGGHECYLFQGDVELTKDHIVATPMRREELEGVALVSTPHGDYALRDGSKVLYSLGEGNIWHIDKNGDVGDLPGSALIGAGSSMGGRRDPFAN